VAHRAIVLVPGVDQNTTPVFPDAGINDGNLIRFVPDAKGRALVQPIGGWVKYFANTISSLVRALWAWADINASNYLAVGAESSLSVVASGTNTTITPRTSTTNPAVAASTTIGSGVVTILDVGSNITGYDTVDVQTQIAVGGLVLFGSYAATAIDADHYSIVAQDRFGHTQVANANVVAGGAVPQYATVNGSSLVTVTLTAHGLLAGQSTFTALVSTTLNTVVIYGDYLVLTTPTANTFTIQCSSAANAGSSAYENGGNARYLYHIGAGSLAVGSGFGVGGYGTGGYGSGTAPTTSPGTAITATDWTLDNWGKLLLACPYGGSIYVWDPNTNQPIASVIANAPTANQGILVAMPERQVIAWGSTFTGVIDPLLIRWCDIQDFTTWVGTSTNQAGSYRISRGSRIVGGLQGPQQLIFWTDVGVWTAQYINQPYIYGFNEVGAGCGLIAPKAAGVLSGAVYWMSLTQFFTLSGDGVRPLVCPIWDAVFQNMNTEADAVAKIRVAPNSQFNEISWYYCSSGASEIDSYIKYNTVLRAWDFGTLSRTAWLDQSVLGSPIGAGSNRYLYQHETGNLADGAVIPTTFTIDYFALDEGEYMAFVDQIWPDMKWGASNEAAAAQIQITLTGIDYPGGAERTQGPYDITRSTTFVTPRMRARMVSMTIASGPNNASFWRLGYIRYRVMPDGKF